MASNDNEGGEHGKEPQRELLAQQMWNALFELYQRRWDVDLPRGTNVVLLVVPPAETGLDSKAIFNVPSQIEGLRMIVRLLAQFDTKDVDAASELERVQNLGRGGIILPG